MNNAVAHISEDGREHSLSEHLHCVGEIAASFASKWGAEELGRVAGRLHDLGKYAQDFQDYIRSVCVAKTDAHLEEGTEDVRPTVSRVNHSAAGALYARETIGSPESDILAFVIAGHHAGLANRSDLLGTLQRFSHRLKDARAAGAPEPKLIRENQKLPADVALSKGERDVQRVMCRLEFFTRMLFSALCDADFLDTEAFFDVHARAERHALSSVSLETLLTRIVSYLDRKEANADASAVNVVRSDIRKSAKKAAELRPGVFSLSVPTGGGKTLASMEFALRHAIANQLDRVIVAIPYTSIIEQNAEVYRAAFAAGNESAAEDVVLEQHCNFDPRRETMRSRLASQNWDAPIIVTTNVQLLESLFARRTSKCRKLHNIARSVIVLDEAQTLPPALLEPTLDALSELTRVYGATVVICTATQPAWKKEHLNNYGFEQVTEIVPKDVNAFGRLRRVDIEWPTSLESIPYESLAAQIAAERDVLAIVHRRDDARKLTELLDQQLAARNTVHLSALMCPEHRSHILKNVVKNKQQGHGVILVATQLVEAGVDIDFPVVYRAMAGLDSLAQAAGRCNREGKLERGKMKVFFPVTSPPKGVLQRSAEIAKAMWAAQPDLDIFSPDTQLQYFAQLYRTGDSDHKNVQKLRTELSFKEVAENYRLIENDWSTPLVVPYGDAPNLIRQLVKNGPSRWLTRRLGRYSVTAPTRLVNQWIASGHAIYDEPSGVIYLASHVAAYDERFGLVPDRVSGPANISALIIEG